MVDTDCAGQGAGTLLMEKACSLADQRNLEMCADATATSYRLEMKHGFYPLEDLPRTVEGYDTSCYFMKRDAKYPTLALISSMCWRFCGDV